MIDVIDYKGKYYPKFQTEGNAAKFIMPFAQEFCKGYGFDIGCGRKEWSLPGSFIVDPAIDPRSDALNLPSFFEKFAPSQVDYIFSSHCLEHVREPWYEVLEYWVSNIKNGGTLFLYLPDYSQEYWRVYNNRKHVHILNSLYLHDAFVALGMTNIFVSGVDLMNSFCIVGQVNREE